MTIDIFFNCLMESRSDEEIGSIFHDSSMPKAQIFCSAGIVAT